MIPTRPRPPRALASAVSAEELDRLWTRFGIFHQQGGKFRVAVTNVCNLDCFFCHNEAMANPRRGPVPTDSVDREQLLGIINAYTRLGGRQVNLTGGEPLARPDLIELIEGIDKRDSVIALNTNAVLASRLLAHPKLAGLDTILVSLHTTDDGIFRDRLGGRSVTKVMDNIIALDAHGYEVIINYSLGPYNRDEFPKVLDFATQNGIFLKAIAFVRPNDSPRFYDGQWVDPGWVTALLETRGAEQVSAVEAFGGYSTVWNVSGSKVKVKNIANGRLETDYCDGCPHSTRCGEGIYGLRVGVDGLWKPCLLNRSKFTPVTETESYALQILRRIDAMIGHWPNAVFRSGAPD